MTLKNWHALSFQNMATCFTAMVLSALLVGCGSTPHRTGTSNKASGYTAHNLPRANSGQGGYYLDDGPADNTPANLASIPDAVPKIELYRRANSRAYTVLGKTYYPISDNQPYKKQGIGSWYGKKFHGKKTASGEVYDMHKMTAAHPILPIPSYARVTNLNNGKQVIVRINDRGPFHSGRIIDLSYTAALKLGYLKKGAQRVEVERLLPAEIRRMKKAHVTNKQNVALAMPTHKVKKKPIHAAHLPSGYYLQLGAYSKMYYANKALRIHEQTRGPNLPPAMLYDDKGFRRLMAGPYPTRVQADNVAQAFLRQNRTRPMVVLH